MNKTPRVPEKSAFTLIELLVVIAIIGILMSLLFPAVNSAIDAAKKAQAKNDVTQIATAVTAYYTEYGKLPPNGMDGTSPTADAAYNVDTNNAIIGTLMGTNTTCNPRQIVFMEVSDVSTKKGKSGLSNGTFIDPWGNLYYIALDYAYNNHLDVSTNGTMTTNLNVMKTVGVWNLTTNSRRQVRSWE